MTSIFETKLGRVGIEGSSGGLMRLILPRRSREKTIKLLDGDQKSLHESQAFLHHIEPVMRANVEKHIPQAVRYSKNVWDEDNLMRSVKKDLIAYLNGERICFDYPVDLDTVSPFVVKVLRTVRTIPYGKTGSYLWVAEKIGGRQFVRAVGQALSKNPLPIIIPCHRVIRSNGDIGGFGGGISLKKKLLMIEGIAI